MGRTFAFSSYGDDGFAAYKAGALCRMDADLRIYGFSPIDPDSENLKRLYLGAMEAYQIAA